MIYNIKNIIFDLDGTLWDSTKNLIVTWNEILSDHGLLETELMPEDMEPYMGLLIEDALKGFFPDISPDKIREIERDVTIKEPVYLRKAGGDIYPNVIETLQELSQKFDLYIVSNCQEGYIEAFLEYFNLGELFIDFESHGKTGKPKDWNIGDLMKRNNLTAENSIYVGDTQTDFDSAAANHLKFIFCTYGFGNIKSGKPDVEISEFVELLNIIKH